MSRLYRPHIPLEVRCRVVMRQLGEMWPDDLIKANRGGLADFLDCYLLVRLAPLLGCEVKDLRLDHNPPLGARPRYREGLGTTRYFPDANDPEYLIYREKHAHHIKTNVRGDGAQHPDRVLIKKERRRLKAAHNRTHKKMGKMGKRRKWSSRPIVGRGFPPKGSRPFRRPHG